MVKVNVYYSIRKDESNLPSIKFFADEQCAKEDQEYFKYWSEPCYGMFVMDVKGTAYIESVCTPEEFIEELKKLPKIPTTLIKRLKR